MIGEILTVTKIPESGIPYRRRTFLCRCECGRLLFRDTQGIMTVMNNSCGKCYYKPEKNDRENKGNVLHFCGKKRKDHKVCLGCGIIFCSQGLTQEMKVDGRLTGRCENCYLIFNKKKDGKKSRS